MNTIALATAFKVGTTEQDSTKCASCLAPRDAWNDVKLIELGSQGVKYLCRACAIRESLAVLRSVVADDKVNAELLTDTFAHIATHPDEWYQGHWRCGSGMCFAGHAVIRAGLNWEHPDDIDSESIKLPNGVVVSCADAAQAVLGLSGGDRVLFDGDNGLEKIGTVIGRILERANRF